MLVLTRREGESLRIGPDVRVTIVTLAGGQVRIGVEAPDAVFVHREEVWERLEESNRAAARAAAALPIRAEPARSELRTSEVEHAAAARDCSRGESR